MSDSKDMVFAPEVSVSVERHLHTSQRTIADMSPEAAKAYAEMSDNEFAVPAREKTKQTTVDTFGRVALGGGLAIAACVSAVGNALGVGTGSNRRSVWSRAVD